MPSSFKLNRAGFVELRTLPVMDELVLKAARAAAAAAGEGFEAEPSPSKRRARATVHPNTAEAALETARNPHTLIAALEAARRVV